MNGPEFQNSSVIHRLIRGSVARCCALLRVVARFACSCERLGAAAGFRPAAPVGTSLPLVLGSALRHHTKHSSITSHEFLCNLRLDQCLSPDLRLTDGLGGDNMTAVSLPRAKFPHVCRFANGVTYLTKDGRSKAMTVRPVRHLAIPCLRKVSMSGKSFLIEYKVF